MFKFSKHSWKELVGVHPELGFMCTEAIKITKQDFMVFDGIRTDAEQRSLFEKGASRTLDSYHLYGLAVDIVPYRYGPVWDVGALKELAIAVKHVIHTHGLHIDNGYDLWGWDRPHWQLTGYKDVYDYRKLS